jgi:hypothetical protein
MKRLVATLLAMALLAGVSSSAWASVAPRKVSKLSSLLLTVGQMPVGWSVESTPSGGGVGCLSNTLEPKGVKQASNAGISFEASGGFPSVEDKLATYSGSASGAYGKVVSDLSGCKKISGKDDGEKVTGTIGQMSLPSYGSQSEAFSISLTIGGQRFYQDAVIVREGSVVMGLSDGNSGPVSVIQFEKFIGLALAKLSGATVSSTTTTTEPAHTVTSAPPGTVRAVPRVTGEQLDQAEATLLSDSLGYKVFGGGIFGIVVASDWTVCSQTPSAGTTANAVNLTVARSCS